MLVAASILAGLVALPGVASADALGVTITAPSPGAIVSGVVEIVAETAGQVASVSFDVSIDDGLTWSLVAVDTAPDDGWSASWDTDGYAGPATVRAMGTDGSATAAATVDVTVDNAPPSLVVSAARQAFSPNGDGRADRTRIVVEVPEPGTLEVLVEDRGGDTLRSLLEAQPVEAGAITVSWAGDRGSGRPVPDGRYRVVADETDPLGTARTAETVVTIDTQAPRFRWLRIEPDPYRGIGRVRFAFRLADRSPSLTVAATIADVTGHSSARIRPRVVAGGAAELSWDGNDQDGTPSEPGLYRVAVTVRDDAGNQRTTEARPFRDHRPVTTHVIRRVEGAGRRVALTFDDCNSADAWGRILDVLDARQAGASFFCSGPRVAASPALALRTTQAGYTIGSHGWDHADFTALTLEGARTRLRRDADVWWRTSRDTPVPYFRPPYGSYDAETLRAAGLEGYGYTVLWDVDPWDWSRPGVAEIVSRVLSHARRGSIVVLHVQDETASALPAIIDGLRAHGLEPVTLAELLVAGER
jgi:peptidoglycan-N-acetylglucosamine deacetylase